MVFCPKKESQYLHTFSLDPIIAEKNKKNYQGGFQTYRLKMLQDLGVFPQIDFSSLWAPFLTFCIFHTPSKVLVKCVFRLFWHWQVHTDQGRRFSIKGRCSLAKILRCILVKQKHVSTNSTYHKFFLQILWWSAVRLLYALKHFRVVYNKKSTLLMQSPPIVAYGALAGKFSKN